MQVLGTGAAPTQLRLHVHLAAAADARAACRHAVLWDFYTDHTRLRNCSFVRDDKWVKVIIKNTLIFLKRYAESICLLAGQNPP